MTTTAATIGRTYRARHHAAAADLDARHAAALLDAARSVATTLPATWQSPGGSDAATVLRFMADDSHAAVNSAALAADAAARLDPDLARLYAENAHHAVGTMRRYLAHLTAS